MGIKGAPDNTGQLVEVFVNTAYDKVETVHDNLAQIIFLAEIYGQIMAGTVLPTTRDDLTALQDGDLFYKTDTNDIYFYNTLLVSWELLSDLIAASNPEAQLLYEAMFREGGILLTNPLSLPNVATGWTNLVNGDIASVEVNGRTGVTAEITSATSLGIESPVFDLDPNGVYELRVSFTKDAAKNSMRIAVSGEAGGGVGTYSGNLLANDSPQAYYKCDDTSGDIVCSVNSPTNDMPVNAWVFTYEQTAVCIEGDGSGRSVLPDQGGSFTGLQTPAGANGSIVCLEMWVLTDAPFSGAKQVLGSNDDFGASYHMFGKDGSDDVTHPFPSMYIGGTREIAPDTHIENDGVPHHFVLQQVTGPTVELWIDGVLQADTYSGSFPFTGDLTLFAGIRSSGSAFEGEMDNIALYTTALTPTQIADHYNKGTSAEFTAVPVTYVTDQASTTGSSGSTITLAEIVKGEGTGMTAKWYDTVFHIAGSDGVANDIPQRIISDETPFTTLVDGVLVNRSNDVKLIITNLNGSPTYGDDASTDLHIANLALVRVDDGTRDRIIWGKIYENNTITMAGATTVKGMTFDDGIGGDATIETRMDSYRTSFDTLNSQWSVKIDTNGFVSGFGLASTPNTEGDVISDFMIHADRFWMAQPSGSKVTITAITRTAATATVTADTTGLVDGVSKVGIGGVEDGTGALEGNLNGVFTVLTTLTGPDRFTIAVADTGATTGAGTMSYVNVNVPFKIGLVEGVSTVGINGNLLVDGTIKTVSIETGAVDTDQLATDAVSTIKIENGAILEAKIDTDAVTNDKIGPNAVDTAEIADDAVGDGQVTGTTISDIRADLGTMTAGTFRTAASPNDRTEISSVGDFPIWVGTGTKSAANGFLYYDSTISDFVVKDKLKRTVLSTAGNAFEGRGNANLVYDANFETLATRSLGSTQIDTDWWRSTSSRVAIIEAGENGKQQLEVAAGAFSLGVNSPKIFEFVKGETLYLQTRVKFTTSVPTADDEVYIQITHYNSSDADVGNTQVDLRYLDDGSTAASLATWFSRTAKIVISSGATVEYMRASLVVLSTHADIVECDHISLLRQPPLSRAVNVEAVSEKANTTVSAVSTPFTSLVDATPEPVWANGTNFDFAELIVPTYVTAQEALISTVVQGNGVDNAVTLTAAGYRDHIAEMSASVYGSYDIDAGPTYTLQQQPNTDWWGPNIGATYQPSPARVVIALREKIDGSYSGDYKFQTFYGYAAAGAMVLEWSQAITTTDVAETYRYELWILNDQTGLFASSSGTPVRTLSQSKGGRDLKYTSTTSIRLGTR